MSFSGEYTPLGLNVIASLVNDTGFAINQTATSFQGAWTPSGYTQGTVTDKTVLKELTAKIRAAYLIASAPVPPGPPSPVDITPDVYRLLLTIGEGVCPALGNSRPKTFKPSYPGFGSWNGGSTPVVENYPPKDYPTAGTYSYIYQDYGEYAWITGWPGKNSWQKDTDTYKAAYLPAAGDAITDYDEYFSNGFIGTIARQAYYEMWTGQFNQTNSIVNYFSSTSSYKNSQNFIIAGFVNTKTFMTGMYSNINDLSTSDIAGVNQAFKIWGIDLINTGRAIYLPDISKFGLPSALLRNLQRNNVVTDAVKLALMLSGLDTSTLNNIFGGPFYEPTKEEERKIYNAFLLIKGDDLNSLSTGVLYGLNCKTAGLDSLADLLDLTKLFPNSYNSLTLPRYSTTTESAKIYDFIYVDGGVNSRIQNWGSYLESILTEGMAVSCGAFAMTMQQIKGILSMDIQKFSQVVANLELTNLNLPLINSNFGVPGNIDLANQMLSSIAFGSGNSKSYRQCDFLGSASGYPYNTYYEKVIQLIDQLTTKTLTNIYLNLPTNSDLEIQAFVASANAEISAIAAANPQLVEQLNYYWDMLGSQLYAEQCSIPMAVPVTTDIASTAQQTDVTSFVSQAEQWALMNSDGQEAPVLEGIADTTIFGGQCLVAMLREARNAMRMSLMGGDLQNNVSSIIDTCCASAYATVTSGVITGVTITSASSGYTAADPPVFTVYPVGGGARLSAVLADDGSIAAINILNGGSGYVNAQIEISPPPQCQPKNAPQQTYADTSESQLVPPELTTIGPEWVTPTTGTPITTVTTSNVTTTTSTFDPTSPPVVTTTDWLVVAGPKSASPTVAEAIADVIACNCDCWDQ